MNGVFEPEARWDIWDIAEYYERQSEGLGERFANAVHAAIGDISDSPRSWPSYYRRLRIRIVEKFPYGVIYRIEGEIYRIYAIADLRRPMTSWISRVKAR